MAMFGYFQNGFVQETDKPEKPKSRIQAQGGSRKGRCKTRTPGSVRHCAPNVQVCCKACSDAGKNKENPNDEKLCSDRKLCL